MRKIVSALALAAFVSVLPAAAFAVQPGEILKDKTLELRAREISAGLRCLVCQNQSVDDSDAQLAKDLRVLVRERLTAGDTDKQVLDYVVSRYGDFVLLKPPFEKQTLALWGAPFAVLLAGGWAIFIQSRRRKAHAGVDPLSAQEKAELETLLKK